MAAPSKVGGPVRPNTSNMPKAGPAHPDYATVIRFRLLLFPQLKNYYTTFFGMAQATAAWLLYVIATDSYRSVACLSYDRVAEIKRKLKRMPRDIVCIVLLIVVFYSGYLPPLRLLLFGVDRYAFFMCNVPFENHWDFRIHEVRVEQSFSSYRFVVVVTAFAVTPTCVKENQLIKQNTLIYHIISYHIIS